MVLVHRANQMNLALEKAEVSLETRAHHDHGLLHVQSYSSYGDCFSRWTQMSVVEMIAQWARMSMVAMAGQWARMSMVDGFSCWARMSRMRNICHRIDFGIQIGRCLSPP